MKETHRHEPAELKGWTVCLDVTHESWNFIWRDAKFGVFATCEYLHEDFEWLFALELDELLVESVCKFDAVDCFDDG